MALSPWKINHAGKVLFKSADEGPQKLTHWYLTGLALWRLIELFSGLIKSPVLRLKAFKVK